MKIVLLDDEVGSYPDSNNRWPGFDCNDKRLQAASKNYLNVEVDKLQVHNRLKTYIIERIRPRYWFIAALDCSGVSRTIEYDLHLRNQEHGWLQELSMDYCGLEPVCVFLVAYVGLA